MFHLPRFKIHSNAALCKFVCTQHLRFATISSHCQHKILKNNTNKAVDLLNKYSLNVHFGKPNTSWNNCIAKAKTLVNYDTDLYNETIMSDDEVHKFFSSQKLDQNKHLQKIVSQFIYSYDYQITGLTTILFAKLILHSKHYWPKFFHTFNAVHDSSRTNLDAKLESDIVKLAQCYDMISYGFYFHDCISPLKINDSTNSIKNLQLLMGDYFFAKALHKISSFAQIELYKFSAQTTVKISEGESLSLTTLENSDESKTIEKLVEYCHLTSGHLLGNSLQSALYQANFSIKAQKLAFEFGKNVGIAIKIANQISALFVSRIATDDLISKNAINCQLPVNHLNLSYYAKFPTINVNVMQNLVEEYSNKAIRLLDVICDLHALEQLDTLLHFNDWTTTVFDSQKLQLGQSPKLQNRRLEKISEKSTEIKEILFQIIQQIQNFNCQNREMFSAGNLSI